MIWPEKWLLAGAALTVPATAAAVETVTYGYDALGRLVAVSTDSGRNDGMSLSTVYDPAGNRANHSVSGTGAGGSAPGSQSSSTGNVMTGLEEEVPAEEAVAAAVEPPPPGGIPDESEPVVEIAPPDGGAADDSGADR